MSDRISEAIEHLEGLSSRKEADRYIRQLKDSLSERELEILERRLLISEDLKK